MQFSIVLSDLWSLVSRTNKYIDETQPWVLAKEQSDKPKLGSVMWNLAESLRQIAVYLQPFMTNSPKQIAEQLGLSADALTWESLENTSSIATGTKVIEKGIPIFPRLEVESEISYIQEQMRGPVKEEEPEIVKEEVLKCQKLQLMNF